MARLRRKTARLPSGLYVRRGRAVRFSDLSTAQRHAWRSFWTAKAAATRARQEARAVEEIVVVESKALRGEMRRRGLRAFRADVPPELATRHAIRAVEEVARERFPKGTRGTYVAIVEWPDDPRGTPGRPYTTRVSRSIAPTRTRDESKRAAERARAYFGAVEEDPAGRLSGPAGQHPSRGRGRAVVKSVHFLTWDADRGDRADAEEYREERRRKRRWKRRRKVRK